MDKIDIITAIIGIAFIVLIVWAALNNAPDYDDENIWNDERNNNEDI